MSAKIAAAVVALFSVMPAWAQQGTELKDVVVSDDPESSYAASRSVSATRTDTPLQQTPQSVSVVKRSVIEDQQSVTLGEALLNASSVVPNAPFSSPAFETTKVRGFAAEQFIDGFTQYYNTGDREGLVNVERIEVLKGANGVLYGGGSGSPVGGAVNIVSKRPESTRFGEVGLKTGSRNFVQPYFDVNQPLSGQVNLRVTGEYTSTDSKVDVLRQDRYNLNPAISFTNNTGTTLTVNGKFSRWEQQEYQGLPATGTVTGNFRIRESLFIGTPDIPKSFSEYQGVWASLDHRFNDQWSMNIKARAGTSEFDEKAQSIYNGLTFDFAANSPPVAGTSVWNLGNLFLTQQQNEKTLLGSASYKFDYQGSKNTLLLGADYSELKDSGFMTFADTGITVDLANPVFSAPYQQPGKSAFTTILDGLLTNTTYGAYAQLQSSIQNRLHLLGSLRHAHVKVDYTELTLATTQVTEKTRVLPKVGAVYDLTPNWSVFAAYSEGLRGQPFSVFAPGSKPEPAESNNKEAGFKFNFPRQLQGQLAYYEVERSKVAVGFPATPNGEQRSRGADAELTWQPAAFWKVLANYAYTDAQFTRDASATVLAGNQLAGVPKNSARLWVNHDFTGSGFPGVTAGLGAYWQGKVFVDDANRFVADSYHTIDAAVSYRQDKYSVGLSVKNLTGESYFQRYEYFGGRIRPDDGTSLYLTLGYRY